MCTYISSDVVLANLLMYSSKSDIGVDFKDIEDYCNQLQIALLESDEVIVKSVSFQINDEELEINLRAYPDFFKRFLGKYYKGINFRNMQIIDELSSQPIRNILRLTAEKI